jgi:hypothetical protein
VHPLGETQKYDVAGLSHGPTSPQSFGLCDVALQRRIHTSNYNVTTTAARPNAESAGSCPITARLGLKFAQPCALSPLGIGARACCP